MHCAGTALGTARHARFSYYSKTALNQRLLVARLSSIEILSGVKSLCSLKTRKNGILHSVRVARTPIFVISQYFRISNWRVKAVSEKISLKFRRNLGENKRN